MIESLTDRLIRHEGLRLMPYTDTVGKLSIGVGRNLSDCGISHGEALYMLGNDVQDVQQEVTAAFPWILSIDDVRQSVIYEMAFQLGIDGLLKFKQMLADMKVYDWQNAAKEMLNSAWHSQTPARCEELAALMANGSNAQGKVS